MTQPQPIVSIVLAAGAGSRFGGPKQLAELGGRRLIEHALAAAARASTDSVIVVLGAHAAQIEATVDFGDSRVVVCESWEEGTGASLRTGLRAVPADCGAAVVTLGDEPFVPAVATERLIAAREPGLAALRATYHGRPGHPVLIERRLFAPLTSPGPAREPRRFLQAAGLREIECGDLGDPGDVDTIAQLRDLGTRGESAGRTVDE
jgi:CTP:molybdopterin cytidylyltransferase MocA